MLISRETDYSIRILRSLGSGEKLTADELCQKELLPKQFAYKILKRLQKSMMPHFQKQSLYRRMFKFLTKQLLVAGSALTMIMRSRLHMLNLS